MPITSTTNDAAALTITVVAAFAAEPLRLWDDDLDPRQTARARRPADPSPRAGAGAAAAVAAGP